MRHDEHGSSDPEDGDTQPPSPGMGARDDDDEGNAWWENITHAAPSDEQPEQDGPLARSPYDAYDPTHWQRRIAAEEEGRRRHLAANTPPVGKIVRMSPAELEAREDLVLQWSIQDIHPKGVRRHISCPAKFGKTTLRVEETAALATGTAFLGTFPVPEPLRVLVLDTEMTYPELREYQSEVAHLPGIERLSVIHALEEDIDGHPQTSLLNLLSDVTRDRLVQELVDHQADIFVIDTVTKCFTAMGLDENDAPAWSLLDLRLSEIVGLAKCEHGAVTFGHTGHDTSRQRGSAQAQADPSVLVTGMYAGDPRDPSTQRFLRLAGRGISLMPFGLRRLPPANPLRPSGARIIADLHTTPAAAEELSKEAARDARAAADEARWHRIWASHPDAFPSENAVRTAFKKMGEKTPLLATWDRYLERGRTSARGAQAREWRADCVARWLTPETTTPEDTP